jgi:hypothetical protein
LDIIQAVKSGKPWREQGDTTWRGVDWGEFTFTKEQILSENWETEEPFVMVKVTRCESCPYFRHDEYESYDTCEKAHKPAGGPIPDWCPLLEETK